MHEIELKFLVPADKLAYIKRQTHIKAAVTEPLAAHYFDTPKRVLAKHGIALRIRKEGSTGEDSCWIQTIKANGDGLAKRIEHNHVLDNDYVEQALENSDLLPDLNIYENTQAGKLLKKLNIKNIAGQLTCLYITDVIRTKRLIKQTTSTTDNNGQTNDHNQSRSVIEVAFDSGTVVHGTDSSQFQPIQEVELELLSGNPAFLFKTAKIWCNRYKLNLSTVTKAERGGLVLKNKAHSKATKGDLSTLSNLSPNISRAAFSRAIVHNCLIQIMPNASAIVASNAATPFSGKHVHQLRVGLRRLRVALKFFADFSEQIDPNWLPIIKQTFSTLGEYRDREILLNKTQPMLESLGSPAIVWSMEDLADTVRQSVQANAFQLVLLELIEFSMSDPKNDHTENNKYNNAKIPAKSKVHKILNKLFNKLVKDSEQFLQLPAEAQHDIRKRLKNLRYLCEFVTPLYGKKDSQKATKNFVQYLRPVQTQLGKYNDNFVGYQYYHQRAKTDPNAWFAVGWFLASEQQSMQKCAESLLKVKAAPKFW